jgi:eukaryotic-like serine/threonine-protein kinase
MHLRAPSFVQSIMSVGNTSTLVASPSAEEAVGIGSMIAGRYRLVEVLGRGAQGVLYRGYDTCDGDEVAAKVFRPVAQDPNALERTFREAHAMMQLAGTAAVRILHHVRTPDGGMCLILELLRGRELKARLEELEAAKRRMSIGELTSIFEPIVETLEAARACGIVHRDIKPGNIFLLDPAHGGGVRLLDFGFARLMRSRPLTAEGMVAGTPSYIAPEVWMGLPAIDHRADVYGLAVILYRVLAGSLPFGSDLETLIKVVPNAPRPSLYALHTDLAPAIDGWVQQALAADREQRFGCARAMWRALLTCL